MRDLGKRLRAAREAAGFDSARAFARAIGVDNSHVSRVEDGEREPSLGLLATWATRCGLDVDVMLRVPGQATVAVDLPPAAVSVAQRLALLEDKDLAFVTRLLDALPLTDAEERRTLEGILTLIAKPQQRRQHRQSS